MRALLIESYEALARKQNEKDLEMLLAAIRDGKVYNRCTLAGLLIRASYDEHGGILMMIINGGNALFGQSSAQILQTQPEASAKQTGFAENSEVLPITLDWLDSQEKTIAELIQQTRDPDTLKTLYHHCNNLSDKYITKP